MHCLAPIIKPQKKLEEGIRYANSRPPVSYKKARRQVDEIMGRMRGSSHSSAKPRPTWSIRILKKLGFAKRAS